MYLSGKKRIISNIQKFTKSLSQLRLVNENLKVKVKTLTNDLEKFNTQLHLFLSGSQKLNNLLWMDKPTENMRGLGYNQTDRNTASTSMTTTVLATNQPRNVANLEPKSQSVLGQTLTRQCRMN